MNVDEIQRQLAERRASEVAAELMTAGWPARAAEAARMCLLGHEREIPTEHLEEIEALLRKERGE